MFRLPWGKYSDPGLVADMAAIEQELGLHYFIANCSFTLASGINNGPASWSVLLDPQHMVDGTSTVKISKTGLWYISYNSTLSVTPVGASTFTTTPVANGNANGAMSDNALMSAVSFGYHNRDSGPWELNKGDAMTILCSSNAGASGTCTAVLRGFYIGQR